MSEEKPFLYQINFNRKKYPEVVEALETAKEGNGIAWYLRSLIMKDIEEKKYGESIQHVPAEEPQKPAAVKLKEINNRTEEKPQPEEEEEKSSNDKLPDDSGGFM